MTYIESTASQFSKLLHRCQLHPVIPGFIRTGHNGIGGKTVCTERNRVSVCDGFQFFRLLAKMYDRIRFRKSLLYRQQFYRHIHGCLRLIVHRRIVLIHDRNIQQLCISQRNGIHSKHFCRFLNIFQVSFAIV